MTTTTTTQPKSAVGGAFEAARSSMVGRMQASAERGRPEPGDIVQAAPRKSPAPARPKRERRRHPWALTTAEGVKDAAVLRSSACVDTAPAEICVVLRDRGVYLRPEATLYRILCKCGSEARERRRKVRHPQ